MPYSTDLSSEILQQLVRLTSIREDKPLRNAFCEFMLEQFESLESIGLYKKEKLQNEVPISLEAFHTKSQEKAFSKELADFILQFIAQNIESEGTEHNSSKHNILISKANREKQIVFFLVYQFSDTINCEQQAGFIPSVLLKKSREPAQIQMIRSLSQIYSNHQIMISLNDKDSLTGLCNRKSFNRQMARFIEINTHQKRRNKETGENNYLAILDIDHFKSINDNYGHLYGDEVLLLFAQQMQTVFREDDLLFRYGGEEFVVIIMDIDGDMAEKALHRFRSHISHFDFPQLSQVTVSIGMTKLEPVGMQNGIVDRADHALYYVKEHGRNNVACYETLFNKGILKKRVTRDDIELF